MADRSWEHGLHQLIEAKEGCNLTAQNDPLSRISYQRFFRRYLRLAGMTGTAREVRKELWSVYRLRVTRIATNRPLKRRAIPNEIYTTVDGKWDAVVQSATDMHRSGRPALGGTIPVAASRRAT